ncbi:hypothetical protein, partial [Methylicorpusculum sp.]|uniref:hypothetical protein n=1 Tax=Methylicorpusculum sp. TaxID=2713644 RepID=UPI0027344E41
LSYGLPFRFQLLSTPFHNDAVTFSYGVMAYADRDFHPVDKLPSWAHDSGNPCRNDGVDLLSTTNANSALLKGGGRSQT